MLNTTISHIMLTKNLTSQQKEELLELLKTRFENSKSRHKSLEWSQVQQRLELRTESLWSLYEMERTGGEPDVLGYDDTTNQYLFVDCSKETPVGRRNTCYDRKALDDRKTFKPATSAVDMALDMGIEILTEEQYRDLQSHGTFDTKTSSWIHTPNDIRDLGGALFADYRYGKVFVYHNGASSYYSSRGFRGLLRV